ncbi:Nuclear LIM interactor-interacting factor 1 [Giardia lamblia P15]|uniref:Nuclear LIM interactor-interacting factor 1 n=1 Tax=Giardia intestinalis (strain P15) TaxID=658858 RepID=E1EWT5_GIAIA|nr:Nuclear LIM interactor-interacting factor 1 [Giardia lamblia P15]
MVDLSSIITQVKQGETMPTPPSPPQAPPTITDTSNVKKTKAAFGGCCGSKSKQKKESVIREAQSSTKTTENAVELQNVRTLATTIEDTMMNDTIPIESGQILDRQISVSPNAVPSDVSKHAVLDKPHTATTDNLESNKRFSRRRRSTDDLTPAATIAAARKATDSSPNNLASSTPQTDEKPIPDASPSCGQGSRLSSEATSPVPSPALSPGSEGADRLSAKESTLKPPPKRMYFTKIENWAPGPDALLPPPTEDQYNKKLLVLDLDETLVHSSFNKVDNADMIIPLSIEDPVSKATISHQVYVYKRPYVDEFLETMAKYYELAIFTASLQVYCDAVMEKLDPNGLCVHRLYRDSCIQSNGVFVKDMSILGRPIESVIILDNCAASYMFQPENGILAVAFYDDKSDTFLKAIEETMIHLSRVEDVRTYLRSCP